MNDKQKRKREISQRALIATEFWVRFGCKSRATALRLAGYSEAICRNPDRVFKSRAVREFLAELGIKERIGILSENVGGGEIKRTTTKIFREQTPQSHYETAQDEANKRFLEAATTKEGIAYFKKCFAELPDESVQAPIRPPGYVEIPNTTLEEASKYSKPGDPFEMGDARSSVGGLSDEAYRRMSSM